MLDIGVLPGIHTSKGAEFLPRISARAAFSELFTMIAQLEVGRCEMRGLGKRIRFAACGLANRQRRIR
jgi:hypothetical protein